ncbi:MAG: YceI family protein [Chloroflexi bacterium]|nr:MAG: YceI family protein [Chloroflexota bacterium]
MLMFLMSRVGVVAAASLSVFVAACGSAAISTPAVPTPTTAAVATPIAAQSSVATSAPTSVASPSSAPASVATTSSSTTAPTVNASAVTLVVDPAASTASYHAHEQLVGRTLPSEAVGTTAGVSGSLAFAADGTIVADQSKISVDLSKLQSDESRRDNFIKGNTLQTSRYPMATFVPTAVQGLPSPLPTSGQVTFQLLGDLTVHGVTKPVTWQVTAQFGDSTVTGDATSAINITEFGMSPPKAGPVLSIEDGLTLELAFTAARQS